MFTYASDHCPIIIDNFEGSIDFLLHLVQKEEIDIYEVPLWKVITQYLEYHQNQQHDIDVGAEFIGTTSTLLWLKSKMLLPQHEQVAEQAVLEEEDPHFTIIHHLVDYCRFKDAATVFTQMETAQQHYFQRGSENSETFKKSLGIEHVSLEDFAQIFQQLLSKSASRKGIVSEEQWKVSDKILWIRQLLKEQKTLTFHHLFSDTHSREELIVTFLAILELMKLGEMIIVSKKSQEQQKIDAASIYFANARSTDEKERRSLI